MLLPPHGCHGLATKCPRILQGSPDTIPKLLLTRSQKRFEGTWSVEGMVFWFWCWLPRDLTVAVPRDALAWGCDSYSQHVTGVLSLMTAAVMRPYADSPAEGLLAGPCGIQRMVPLQSEQVIAAFSGQPALHWVLTVFQQMS